MRQLLIRTVVGLCCALITALPSSPIHAQDSAKLTLVFLKFSPGGDETVVTRDAREVLTEGELSVITGRKDYNGVVSLAKVVEVSDVDLPDQDRRAVVVLTRWPADEIERPIALPREPGIVYLQAIQPDALGKVFMVYSSTDSARRGPHLENGRFIRFTVDRRDGATVLYAVDRPGRPRLDGAAFTWRK